MDTGTAWWLTLLAVLAIVRAGAGIRALVQLLVAYHVGQAVRAAIVVVSEWIAHRVESGARCLASLGRNRTRLLAVDRGRYDGREVDPLPSAGSRLTRREGKAKEPGLIELLAIQGLPCAALS